MAQVKSCPRCRLLMWIKEDQVEYVDENSMRVKCPHCQHVSTFKLVTSGANANGPKMGH